MNDEAEMKKRLTELRGEFEKGKQMLNDLATQEQDLREKMLRISGGIQVLEELLDEPDTGEGLNRQTK